MGSSTFFGLVRFVLIGSILYFLYAGNKVAKWLIVIITLINGITRFLALLLAFNRALIAIDMMNIVIEIIYITIGVVFIVSSPVNNFFRFQHGEYKDESNDLESENYMGLNKRITKNHPEKLLKSSLKQNVPRH